MKTRIVHTKIHFEDDWFNTLSIGYRYLFMYLFTNTHIGLTGIYHLPKRVALLETGATSEQWDEAMLIFRDGGKIKQTMDWFCMVNAPRYASYSGIKNEVAYKKELLTIPQHILEAFSDTVSIPYTPQLDTPINHKSEIINKKPETINQKEEINKEERRFKLKEYVNERFRKTAAKNL